MQQRDDFLTSEQLRRMFNVSRAFINVHIADRRLPGMVKVGSVWRFKRSAVERRMKKGELLLPLEREPDGSGNKDS